MEKRKAVEDLLIKKNHHRCYNKINSQPLPNNVKTIKPLIWEGVHYQSAHEVARILGINRTNVKRRCHSTDPADSNCYFLPEEESLFGSIPIFAKKGNGPSVLFNSYKACRAAGYATNNKAILQNIKHQKEGWRYAHVEKDGKPIRKPYQLKKGEIS